MPKPSLERPTSSQIDAVRIATFERMFLWISFVRNGADPRAPDMLADLKAFYPRMNWLYYDAPTGSTFDPAKYLLPRGTKFSDPIPKGMDDDA